MKLPLNEMLTPLIRPNLGPTRLFCRKPIFTNSHVYTYLHGIFGLIITANHLKRHLGENVPEPSYAFDQPSSSRRNPNMLVHDFKIIACAMALVQYMCVLVGCITKNPALFLPHLFGQLITLSIKFINALLLLAPVNIKEAKKLLYKVPAIALVSFNWLQEFCVFRRCLSVCDL